MHNPYVASTPLNYYLEMLDMLDNDASVEHKQGLHILLTALGQVIQTTVKDKDVYPVEPNVVMGAKSVSWFRERVCYTHLTYEPPLGSDTPFLTIEVALDQVNPDTLDGELCETPDVAINNCMYLTPTHLRHCCILTGWWRLLPETPLLIGSCISVGRTRILFRYGTVLITVVIDPRNIPNRLNNHHTSTAQGETS